MAFYQLRKPPIHHTVDLDEKPLLYEYYANTLNPMIDRRSFIDSASRLVKRSIDGDLNGFGKRYFLERSRVLPSLHEQQQKQVMIAPCFSLDGTTNNL